MKSCAPIIRAAVSTSAADASGRPSLMLSATDPPNRKFSWVITMISDAEHGVGQLPQVDPVQRDPARAGIVEPAEQARDRRLARAGLADQGDRLPGRYVQVEAGQHEVVPVAEGHRLEPYLPSGRSGGGDGRLAGPAPRPARQRLGAAGSGTAASCSSTPEIFSRPEAADWKML